MGTLDAPATAAVTVGSTKGRRVEVSAPAAVLTFDLPRPAVAALLVRHDSSFGGSRPPDASTALGIPERRYRPQ